MADSLAQKIRDLKADLTEAYLAQGRLHVGETTSLRMAIYGADNRLRNTINIEDGIDVFTSGGVSFYTRPLKDKEMKELQGLLHEFWPKQWLRGAFSRILEQGNPLLGEEDFIRIATEEGYERRSGSFDGGIVRRGINRTMKQYEQPFSIVLAPPANGHAGTNKLYRLFRAAHEPTGETERAE